MEEAKVIQQWGAFYFLRKTMQIPTYSELWYIEAGKIIVKITLILVAFVMDIATGIIYLILILIKVILLLIVRVIGFALEVILRKIIGIIAYLLSLILTIAVLYVIITHWEEFKGMINWLIHLING